MNWIIQISEKDYMKCISYLQEGINDPSKASLMCKIVQALLNSEEVDV